MREEGDILIETVRDPLLYWGIFVTCRYCMTEI
jgi:hypothetical protein